MTSLVRNTYFRPLLAASPWKILENLTFEEKRERLMRLRYPVWATPKMDGIRCSTTEEVVPPGQYSAPVCRSLKPLPNDYVRGFIATLPPGHDGEILTYPDADLFAGNESGPITIETRPDNFDRIQSKIMSISGAPCFRYMVFDYFHPQNRIEPYWERMFDGPTCLKNVELPSWCIKVLPTCCNDADELLSANETFLAQGYEGTCFRTAESPAWKITSLDGRSTLAEQWLVKMKLFETSEAEIIDSYEELSNNNPMTLGLKGNAERSSHKANMTGKNALGGFTVRDLKTGVEFNIGIGFTKVQRWDFWRLPNRGRGLIVTYKHQPFGAKNAPRIAVFVGFRDPRDMS